MEDVAPASDPYRYLGLTPNPDGSVTRKPSPTTPASSDSTARLPVITKDVFINEQTNTWARLYLPRNSMTKLPLIVYHFGGGFATGTAASTVYQKFCHNVVLQTPALMVSVSYRLAPEHRLPAAYYDGLDALHWLKTTDEEWLTKFADFSKCFLLGTSSGANITYYIGSRAAACVDQLAPLKIRGLILEMAFFGGVQRTPSEIRLANNKAFPVSVSDVLWDLALPIGAGRDHEYCDPTKDVGGEAVEKVRNEGWRVLVTGYKGDPLVDRQMEVAKMLKDKGVDVKQQFIDGGYHGIDVVDADGSYANSFYEVLKEFVLSV